MGRRKRLAQPYVDMSTMDRLSHVPVLYAIGHACAAPS